MAPKTRTPDSLASQSGWKSVSFKIGSNTGKRSSRNTLARTSKAAAEHFPVDTETKIVSNAVEPL